MNGQRTFAQLRRSGRSARSAVAGPGRRLVAKAKAHNAAARVVAPTTIEREEAANRLEELMHEFVAGLGVGGEFQTADFDRWLGERGERSTILDPRALGGIVKRLRADCIVGFAGYRNAAYARSSTHSGMRVVWRVERVPAHARKEAAAA